MSISEKNQVLSLSYEVNFDTRKGWDTYKATKQKRQKNPLMSVKT